MRKEQASMIYANDADLSNDALFAITAQQFRNKNPNAEGNICDHSNLVQN